MARDTIRMIIAGHVDHGKSTLIGRILLNTRSLAKGRMAELKKIARDLGKDAQLAYLTDQLREEREEERTIDTTQVFFKTRKRNFVIIDVPGHVEFIKNMITGATNADTAVLVVSIDSGIEDQTRRHAYITNMLGLTSKLVLINKMDLIDYNETGFLELKNKVLELLASLGMLPSFIIPISATEGENISRASARMRWYKGPCLVDALDSLPLTGDISKRPLRFPIQDIYAIDGERIVVGKVLSGTLRRGQAIEIFPSSGSAQIKSIKTFGKPLSKASSGENVGLILDTSVSLKRGLVIAEKASGVRPTNHFKANVLWMSDKPLETGRALILRCATQEVGCAVETIEERIDSSTFQIVEKNAATLKLNEVGTVLIKTEAPMVVESFDTVEELGRFVLESGLELCGAGIITAALRQNHLL